jgi:hypothetical protein
MRSGEQGVRHLVRRLRRLGARGGGLLVRLPRLRFAPVVFRLADEVLRAQLGEAPQIRFRERRLRLRLGELRLRRGLPEPRIARVEHRHRLSGTYPFADFHLAGKHLTGQAE